MKRGLRSSIGLSVKILIILLLPLLLFSYVDSQPSAVARDEDEGTRNIAIVNEDIGYMSENEEFILGQDITSLLNERDDYTWVVVNRSAAEQGFSNGRYDAVFYVPSNFSENIMTFKDESPTKASINYIIQPNIEAKDRQRLHREMANAQNTINQEMSTIYWSYVSQEIDHIREQFDDVLEKEIAFQDAMYSFYTPSSETLANEIDRHKDRLENILNQTDRVSEVSGDYAGSAAEAEDSIAQFTEALDMYKESQLQQELLLRESQLENQTMIQLGVDSYREALTNYASLMNEQVNDYESPVFRQNNHMERLDERFTVITNTVKDGKEAFEKWDKKELRNLRKQIFALNEAVLEEYNRQLAVEAKDHLFSTLDDLEVEQDEDEESDLPEIPDMDEEFVDFEELKDQVDKIRQEVTQLENTIGDSITVYEDEESASDESADDQVDEASEENEEANTEAVATVTEIDWNSVYKKLQKIDGDKGIITSLEKEMKQKDVPLEKQLAGWEDAYEELDEVANNLTSHLIEHISEKQDTILENKHLRHIFTKETIEELETALPDENVLNNQPVELLMDYANDLTILSNKILERSSIDQNLIKKLFASEVLQDELENMPVLDMNMPQELDDMFTLLVDEEDTKGELTKLEENFDSLVGETVLFLEEYEESVQEQMAQITEILGDLTEQASLITEDIHEVNAETFEWKESPSVEYLDGHMVFSFQQGTASSLENLSNLVGALDESQRNITEDTADLQDKVSSVQQESDDLNQRWSANVATTELMRDDVYDVLANTIVDGQTNPFIYNYLSNPVNVEGQVDGKVLSETEDRMPPVILFIIILLSGLLIGFLTQYYSKNSYLIQAGLFVLLNLSVGLIISIYGLNIYPLADSQAILWSAFTILLLMACSNIVRGGLFVGPFVGWLVSLVMIVFFISPLLNIVVPEFSFNNPVSNVYMGLLYGTPSSYGVTMTALALVILLVSALIYSWQIMNHKAKAEGPNDQKAS